MTVGPASQQNFAAQPILTWRDESRREALGGSARVTAHPEVILRFKMAADVRPER